MREGALSHIKAKAQEATILPRLRRRNLKLKDSDKRQIISRREKTTLAQRLW
jgi:hypothetical protein